MAIVWTPEKIERLKTLCFAGVANAEIAEDLGCSLPNVYAKRSYLGLTIDKCAKQLNYLKVRK